MHITRQDDSHIYVSYYQQLGGFSSEFARSVQVCKVYFYLFGLWSFLYFSSERFVLLRISLKQHMWRKQFLVSNSQPHGSSEQLNTAVPVLLAGTAPFNQN